MAMRPAESSGTNCKTCAGKGYVVRQKATGNVRVTCASCAGTGFGGYRTK